MPDDHDPLDGIGLKSCPQWLTPMVDAGDAHEVAVADGTVIVGTAYWRCPACGLDAIA